MLGLFRGIADEILVAVDDRAGPGVEAALAAVADRVIRYPYAEPVDRPLAWLHAQCSGDWVLTIDDDEIPSQALLDVVARTGKANATSRITGSRGAGSTRLRPISRRAAVAAGLPAAARAQRPARALVPGRDARAGEGARAVADTSSSRSTTSTRCSTRARRARRRRVRYERLHPGKRVAGRPLNEAFYLPEDRRSADRCRCRPRISR